MTEWEALPRLRPRLVIDAVDSDGNEVERVRCWGFPRPPRKIGQAIWRTVEIWKPY